MNSTLAEHGRRTRRPLWRRRGLWLSVSAIVVLVAAAVIAGNRLFGTPHYRGPVSDHFNGSEFVNRRPIREHSFGDLVRHIMAEAEAKWDDRTDNDSYPPPPERAERGELYVTFVGHSTVLIQMDGLNILTDPMWSERASPVSFIGPGRVRPAGVALGDLPPVDYVLLSHNHYDHMDLPTLRQLAEKHAMPIITGLGNTAFLDKKGVAGARDFDWGDSLRLTEEVTLFVLPARHFSGRGLTDHHRSLWVSFLLKGPAGAVYFAGDSGYDTHFARIGRRFGPIRLAILPIGCYLPDWFMGDVHLSPREALMVSAELRAPTALAVHFGTFELGTDGQYQAAGELQAGLEAAEGNSPGFWVLDFGEGRRVPPADGASR
ncbi:MAG: MBL fold metallo-hydrolase [Candidatus Zixiibacteriota bacterium]|nr:MAG: MBL fold metallo-hydrolase [candidate division Zixibacteria bacterium]